MRITSQEEYGFRCILQLAAGGEDGAMTIPQIAKAEGLSVPYVAKLMSTLREAGLVTSERGVKGGFHLSRNASEIPLVDVLLALDDTLFYKDFCQRYSGLCGECVHNRGSCGLRAVWSAMAEHIHAVLSQTTLAELVHNKEPVIKNMLRLRFGEPSLVPIASRKG